MSFLKRIGSVRRRGTYNLSSTGSEKKRTSQALSEGTARMPSGLIQCHITLLDESSFTCEMNKYSLGSTLLDNVLTHCDIIEKDYFGLAFSDGGLMKWLDSEKPLKKQFRAGISSMVLEFRVKYYASDPVNLIEELTRYLFFRQIKKDILDNRLPCPAEAGAILSAFALQAEIGDYDPHVHLPGYVSEFRFVQHQDEAFENRVQEIHQGLRGQSNSQAEFNFLRYSRQLEFYGIEQYFARDDHGIEITLGVGADGIVVFRDMMKLSTFSWAHVLKITYSRKKFFIELRPGPEFPEYEKVIGFHMETHDASKRLWRTCIEHHAFFRMTEIKKSPQRGSPFRRSRARITRRTERQVVEASKNVARERVTIQRTPSKRYPRRPNALHEGDLTGGYRPRANTEIKRTESLRDRSRPVALNLKRVVSPDLTPRRHSDRDITPVLSSTSPTSPPYLDEGPELAGQFELGKTEEIGLTMLYFSNHIGHEEEESIEYYDELNAAEELAGQMTVDDLASEGLLLIRLNPDQEGRFGFHVKGGTDFNLPVFISKVKEDSPASQCQPPLQEGDQVLFINGMPTDNVTHFEVITSIKASLDLHPPQLAIIIRPRDMTRVDPTTEEAPKTTLSDPASLLRESIRHLKEGIHNNSLVTNFDRLYRKKPGMLIIASKLPQNLSKNRFRDITAYDVTRVNLLDGPVDYINANYITMDIPSTGQVIKYIATQGPMQNTCIDFWQMVWEQGCSLIVMLTDVVEEGKVKCCRYWPDQGTSTEYGPFEIYCDSDRMDGLCSTRRFILRNNKMKEHREVIQLQFLDWPEHNIPRTKADFLRFVRRLHSYREGMNDPIVVHCSGGIDRTGVLIAMETALSKMEIVEPLYPLEIVRIMRDQRGMMLPAVNQYRFFCECIIQAYEGMYMYMCKGSSCYMNNIVSLMSSSYKLL